jgi:hypothetical protein
MPERRPEFPVWPREIVSCLEGRVYLAAAERPTCGTVVAAGFGHEDALTRARTRATALDDLYRIRAGPGAPGVVEGHGVISGVPYLLPAEVMAPAAAGVVEDPADQVSSAIADVLACHVAAGWWGHPRIPLLRVRRQLRDMIAPAEAAGLAVSAYVLPGTDFQTVLVCVAARAELDSAVIGVAAGRLVASAASAAFLRALAAHLRPHGAVATHHLAWRCRAADVAWLERSALEADLSRADELAFWEGLPDWADIARRQFGHEPVLLRTGPSGRAAKVICPGASLIGPRAKRPGRLVPRSPGTAWAGRSPA